MVKNSGKESGTSKLGSRGASLATFILLGKIITVLFTGIAFIVVARLLGPSTYGVYTLAMGIIGVASAFGVFGGTTLNKFISQYKNPAKNPDTGRLITTTFALIMLVGIIELVGTVILSNYLASSVIHSSVYGYVVSFAALSILFSITYDASYGILVGLGETNWIICITVIEAVAQAVSSITLAYFGYGAIAPIFGLMIGLGLGALAVFYIVVKKLHINVIGPLSKKYFMELSGFSLPIALANFFTTVGNYSGVIVLGIFATTVIAGNFGVVSKISTVADLITGSIFMASISMFSMAMSKKSSSKNVERLYNYSLYVGFVLLAPALFYMALLAKPFSFTVFGSYYSLAPGFIALTCFGLLLSLFGNYAKTIVISTGRSKDLVRYGIITTILEIISILVLVPLFGGVGLIISLFYVTTISDGILFTKRVGEIMGVKVVNLPKLARVVIANAITSAFLLPVIYLLGGRYISILIVSLIVEIIFYPIVLALTGSITMEDLKKIGEVSSGIPLIKGVVGILAAYTSRFMPKA
jgi:O-antigen/teichoic acid export membrane protein